MKRIYLLFYLCFVMESLTAQDFLSSEKISFRTVMQYFSLTPNDTIGKVKSLSELRDSLTYYDLILSNLDDLTGRQRRSKQKIQLFIGEIDTFLRMNYTLEEAGKLELVKYEKLKRAIYLKAIIAYQQKQVESEEKDYHFLAMQKITWSSYTIDEFDYWTDWLERTSLSFELRVVGYYLLQTQLDYNSEDQVTQNYIHKILLFFQNNRERITALNLSRAYEFSSLSDNLYDTFLLCLSLKVSSRIKRFKVESDLIRSIPLGIDTFCSVDLATFQPNTFINRCHSFQLLLACDVYAERANVTRIEYFESLLSCLSHSTDTSLLEQMITEHILYFRLHEKQYPNWPEFYAAATIFNSFVYTCCRSSYLIPQKKIEVLTHLAEDDLPDTLSWQIYSETKMSRYVPMHWSKAHKRKVKETLVLLFNKCKTRACRLIYQIEAQRYGQALPLGCCETSMYRDLSLLEVASEAYFRRKGIVLGYDMEKLEELKYPLGQDKIEPLYYKVFDLYASTVAKQGVWASKDTVIFSPYASFKKHLCDTSTKKGKAFFILQNILAYHLDQKDTASFVCWELERLRFAAHLFSDGKKTLTHELDFLIALSIVHEDSPLQIGILYHYIQRLEVRSSDALEQKYVDFYERVLSRITYWQGKVLDKQWKRVLLGIELFIPKND